MLSIHLANFHETLCLSTLSIKAYNNVVTFPSFPR